MSLDENEGLLLKAVLDGMSGDSNAEGSVVAAHMPTFHMLAYHSSFGHVVELGVNRGWSTAALFAGAASSGRKLISYDHRAVCKGSLPRNLGLPPDHPLLSLWDFRVKDSVRAAEDFEDKSVSLWFLDTIHTLDHTAKELAAWLPKMHAAGIMCGHDYLMEEYKGFKYGVRQAVDEFVRAHSDRFSLQVLPHDCGLFVLRPRTGTTPP